MKRFIYFILTLIPYGLHAQPVFISPDAPPVAINTGAPPIAVAGSACPGVTANAGADQAITVPTNQVTLSGSLSGFASSFFWEKLSGGTATIQNPNSISTVVTGLSLGVYTFRLTVGNGCNTGRDTVQILVIDTTGQGFTNIPAGVTIESIGGQAFYKPVYGLLKAYPDPANNRTRIQYLGADNLFNAGFVGKEFVLHDANRNPDTLNKVNAKNAGYFPGIVSSRSAVVTSVTDSKNLYVNFVYNGGNPSSPQITDSASGAFWFDNQPVINAYTDYATAANDTLVIRFQAGQRYAASGYLGIHPRANLFFAKAGSGANPWFKIMMDGASDLQKNDNIGQPGGLSVSDGYPPGFAATYHSRDAFLMDNGAATKSVVWLDVNIIPTTYTVNTSQYGSAQMGSWFKDEQSLNDYVNLANGGSLFSDRKMYIINSDIDAELNEITASGNLAKLKTAPTYALNMFAESMRGGTIAAGDIAGKQIFGLFNTNWRGRSCFTVKSRGRAGNWLLIYGRSHENKAEIKELTNIKSANYTASITYLNNREYVINTPGVSTFSMTNQNTGEINTYQQNYVGFTVAGNDVGLSVANETNWRIERADSFNATGMDYLEGDANATAYTIKDGKHGRVFDRILTPGSAIKTWKKIDGHSFVFFGWGVKGGDILRHESTGTIYRVEGAPGANMEDAFFSFNNSKTYLGPYRYSDYDYRGYLVRLVDTLTGNYGDIGEAGRPVFTVIKSATQTIADGTPKTANFVYTRGKAGHINYDDPNTNYVLKRVRLDGTLRFEDKWTYADSTKLYTMAQQIEFEDVDCVNSGETGLPIGRTLYYRGRKTGQKLYQVSDNSAFHPGPDIGSDCNRWWIKNNSLVTLSERDRSVGFLYSPKVESMRTEGVNIKAVGDSVLLRNISFTPNAITGDAKSLNLGGDGYFDVSGLHFTANANTGYFDALSVFYVGTSLEIFGNGGDGGFYVPEPTVTPAKFKLNLTNWTPRNIGVNPTGWIVPASWDSDPLTCSRIKRNGVTPTWNGFGTIICP